MTTVSGPESAQTRNPAACRLNHVSKYFRKGGAEVCALKEVDLEVARGERLGIIGESGSGKSTIGRLVLGMIRADAGSIDVLGRDCTALPKADAKRHLARQIGFVFQQPFDSLDPRMRIGASIAEPVRIHASKPHRDEVRERVEHALLAVGLPKEFARRYPGQLSGGQAQRAGIARALILEPELLVLDEPTSALDATTQREVLRLLSDLQSRRGMAWIFITHDLRVAEAVTDKIAVLRRGCLEEFGTTDEVLNSPRGDYCKELIEASLTTRIRT